MHDSPGYMDLLPWAVHVINPNGMRVCHNTTSWVQVSLVRFVKNKDYSVLSLKNVENQIDIIHDNCN